MAVWRSLLPGLSYEDMWSLQPQQNSGVQFGRHEKYEGSRVMKTYTNVSEEVKQCVARADSLQEAVWPLYKTKVKSKFQ